MEIKKVKVGLARTINTGNYENIKVNIECDYDIEHEDEIDEVFETVNSKLKKLIREKLRIIDMYDE